MVGARSFAMALNRLIDAGIDARNPRTAGRELPRGALLPWQVVLFCPRVARDLPRRRLPACADRRLAVADPGGGLRPLPVPEARHLALPLLARRRRRPRSDRGLGGRDERAPRGRPGCSAAPSRSGSRASTSSTRSSISRSTGRRACTRSPRGSASARQLCGSPGLSRRTVALLVGAGLGLPVGVLYWLGVAAVGRAPRLRARARLAAGLAPARHGLLHHERRHQPDVLRVRARGRPRMIDPRPGPRAPLRREDTCSTASTSTSRPAASCS